MIGYKFLLKKLQELWQPKEEINLIDLGYDFYLIKFIHMENYSHALHGGPWFISGHYLAIRQWQPCFKPS